MLTINEGDVRIPPPNRPSTKTLIVIGVRTPRVSPRSWLAPTSNTERVKTPSFMPPTFKAAKCASVVGTGNGELKRHSTAVVACQQEFPRLRRLSYV